MTLQQLYPPPTFIGGRSWCVELRRRITGLVGPDIIPPRYAAHWPDTPGMYNARTVAGRPWDPVHGWPPGTPSPHAYCDGDDYMSTHLPADRALALRQKIAWIAVVMLTERDPIKPRGLAAGYVQEVIANRTIWTRNHPTGRPYTGPSSHEDHVHISIVRPGSPLWPYPGNT